MITCQDDLVQLYVDGDLQPAEAAIVEAHLEGCVDCRRRVGFYRGLYWELAHADRLAPTAEMDHKALADQLRVQWLQNQPEEPPAKVATSWLTANPVMVTAGRAAGTVGRAGLSLAGEAGRRLTHRLFRRRGGGDR